MRTRDFAISCLVVALFLLPATAAAQTTTGTVDGVVLGPDGLPLPGVAVVANSPSLIRPDLTVFSNDAGYFRLSLLPPGVYELEFRLEGFTIRQQGAVVVPVNQTTAVNVTLNLAAVEDTLVVLGDIPTIDPSSAKLAFNYDQELIKNIPTARDVHDLFSTVPGVESVNNLGGQFQPGTIELQNVLGTGERSSSYRLDGGNTTDPAGQWNMQGLMPYDAIEAVQVIKAAKPAEVAFQGGLFNVITKSGGNNFSGQLGGYYSGSALAGSNTQSTVDGDVGNELIKRYEVTGSVGGRLIRDKLWWHASGRYQDGTTRLATFPADIDERISGLSGKLTYQLNDDHRINAFATNWDQEVSHYFFGFSPTLSLDEQASSFRPLNTKTIGARWSATLSDRIVAEAGLNYSSHSFDQRLQPGGDVAIVDLVTGLRARSPGVSAASLREQDNDLWSFTGSVSWYIPDAAGRHEVKAGFEYLPTTSQIKFTEPGDHQLHTLFGRKFAVRFLNTPTHAIWENDLISGYLQDAWTINDRLTINAGLRYMSTNAGTPEQTAGGGAFSDTSLVERFPQMKATTLAPTDLISWSTIEPRLAASYLLGRDGRSVIRAGISRYYHNLPSYGMFVLTPAFPHTWVTRWDDANNDGAYQVGEEGALMFTFGGQLNSVDPNIKRPYSDEFLVGFSHSPSGDTQISANFIYRHDRDITATVDVGVPFDSYTPVTVNDPGPDGIPGTGDDGTITVFAQDPDTIGDSRLLLTNPEGNERTYKGIEFVASRRFSNRWQAVVSLVVAEMEVIQPTIALSTIDLYDNPNGLINAKGLDPAHQSVQLKLQGTYQFDFGLGVSGLYRFRSGNRYTRELPVVGLPQGPFSVRAESRGASTTDSLSVLDLRLEQGIDTASGRFGLIVDVFNLFNASPTVHEGAITGVNYGQPLSIVSPRVARIGLRYTW